MKFKAFSKKQIELLTWWCKCRETNGYDGVIADGAVRSGKTLCMSISFIAWSFYAFDNSAFAICGKTITSLRRNVITPLLGILRGLGFACDERVSRNYIDIALKGKTNRYYLFGGRDESSAALIQGVTLSGIMLDEVALMPRSFVEQALARCSIDGSKFWFNCNPEYPFHWFNQEWIKKAQSKNTLYLHFKMEDNPSLAPAIIERYKSLYSGVFYERFVLGKWVKTHGSVYPMFDMETHLFDEAPNEMSQFYVSCDYGIVNPTSMGLWGCYQGNWYRVDEYYYSSKKSNECKTDEEYYSELETLIADRKIEAVIVDPSASSFIECIRRHGRYKVIHAKNDVVMGIRKVCDLLKSKKLFFSSCCKDIIREFSLYSWQENSQNDAPKKENDHAMDDMRYFVSTVLEREHDDFFVLSASRR